MLWCSLLKSKSVSMLLIMMLSGLLILQRPPTPHPPPYYPYEGVVYHVKTYKNKFNEIVEPHKKKTTGEHRIVSFKNNWAFDKGEPKGLD